MAETKFRIGNPMDESNPNMDHPEPIMAPLDDDPIDEWVEDEFDRESNFLYLKPRIINDRGCDTLIDMFDSMPYDDVTVDPDNETFITPSERVQEFNLSYKYESGYGKEHMTVNQDSPEFTKVMDVVGDQFIDHRDFDRITYCQIVRYKTDAFFPYHRDMAKNDVGRDYGTCIVQLNDDFHGGQLNVEGCIIPKRAGTMAFFNNSSEVWHGVEPIYEGERYVLLIWFGREYESDSEVQPEEEKNMSQTAKCSQCFKEIENWQEEVKYHSPIVENNVEHVWCSAECSHEWHIANNEDNR